MKTRKRWGAPRVVESDEWVVSKKEQQNGKVSSYFPKASVVLVGFQCGGERGLGGASQSRIHIVTISSFSIDTLSRKVK